MNWQQLTRRQLQQYARTKAARAASTKANAFTTWRVFFTWAVGQEYIPTSPAEAFKTPSKPKPLPRALALDQVRGILAYIDQKIASDSDRLIWQRDRMVILTGLYAGLRASEMAMLRWTMLDLDGRALSIPLSKMNRGRAVVIHKSLVQELTSWQRIQSLDRDAPVFSLDGVQLVPDRIGKICRRLSHESGIPFTTHCLRHTFATWSLRQSGDLFAVSKALGHSQLQQTTIYLAADMNTTRRAVESLPDLGNW
jgi:site-specific recombinase XerC